MTTKELLSTEKTKLISDSEISVAISKIRTKYPKMSVVDVLLHYIKLGIVADNSEVQVLDGVEIDYSDISTAEMRHYLAYIYKDSPDEDIVLDWSKVKKFE